MVESCASIYKAIPIGWPEPGKHLEVQSFPFDLEATPPKDGLVTQNVAPMQPGTAVIAVHIIKRDSSQKYPVFGNDRIDSLWEPHGDRQAEEGETILVSAAAGAVGQIVGQLAAKKGLTVIGSVGDDAKLDFITQKLGFHSGFNYKKEKPTDALKRLAPNGIDIFYDNVGGELLDVAIADMRDFGRIGESNMPGH
ncbi:putative Enoyl reductase (ER) domain-containing protein [Seiridium unicorne]|uniref:Enoyl reductase (ER) domain-containing protein n=1 Tax=Seiridium unicorne TaxID=138068 RepID=A0ABR2V7K8_9PEZI